MAIADTANLIVSLKLDDRFSGPMRNVNRAFDNFTRNASVRGGVSQIGQGIGIGIQRGAVVAAAGLAIMSTQIRAGVESLRELENVNAQTVAGLKSTAGASGQTLESIRALAEEYEQLGGVIDDKVIQNGANVLLTFRRITEDAFEPALEAALNLSTALGTDLDTAILQVGKALDDPIRGVTALRRAGVQLTDEQQKQIKTLVEQNRLYEAQQIILRELERQVGGRFAAAGRTNEATIGRMGDAWEDLQQTLSRATLPVLDKVARRLTTIFSDPQVIAGVEEFGQKVADFLTEENLDKAEDAVRGLFGYLASVPWGAIGDGLRIAGQAASVAISAFKSLPPGVQNALITLLAANKLTGGLVASGLGQLVGVALQSLKTITAGHVTVVGGSVTGGGVPGGGGAVGRGARAAGAIAAVPLAGIAAVEVINFESMREESREGLQAILDGLPRASEESVGQSIAKIEDQLNQERPLLEGILFHTNVRPQLEAELAELQAIKGTIVSTSANASSLASAWNSEQRSAYATMNSLNSRTASASEVTASKDFNPEVNVHAQFTAQISVHDQQRVTVAAIRARSATGFI